MADDKAKEDEFELVFEGPQDESPDTLRSLKGALIADLEFSIAEVQHFLESAPLTIKRSDDVSELELVCNKLKRAGGRLFIVQRKDSAAQPETPEATATPESEVSFLGFELDNQRVQSKPQEDVAEVSTPTPQEPEAAQGDFVLELDLDSAEAIPNTPKEPPVYTLTETALEELEPELVSNSEPSIPTVKSDLFELDLGFAKEDKQLEKNTSPATPQVAKSEEFDLSLSLDSETEQVQAAVSTPLPKEILDLSPEISNELSAPLAEPKQIKLPREEQALAKLQLNQPESAPLDLPKNTELPAESSTNIARSQSSSSLSRQFTFKRKSRESTVLYALLAVALLLGTNWYFLRDKKNLGLSETQIDRILKGVRSDIAVNKKVSSVIEQLQKPLDGVLRGQKQEGKLNIEWDLDASDDALSGGWVQINGEAPPKLTALEISQRKIAPAWLRKVRMDNLKFEKVSANTWNANTLAKAYVEYAQRGFRLVAKAELSIEYNAAENTLKGAVTITHNTEQAPTDSNFQLEQTGLEEFKLYLKSNF